MKVLYDLIKGLDPKALWDSLNLTTLDLTHERVDAFLRVYCRIIEMTTVSRRLDLERVVIEQHVYRQIFLVLNRDLSIVLERIGVTDSNLIIILSLHVPSDLYDVCQTTVINELFRCLIAEELEKPEYKYKRLRRQMIDEIDHSHTTWADRCEHNQKALEKDREKYKEPDLHRSIRKECREVLPEMGRRFYWDVLIKEAIFTESFCRSMLPINPPSLSRLYEVRSIIEKEIERVLKISEYDEDPGLSERRLKVSCRIRLMLQEKGTIIVSKNYIPGMRIPIIYKIDSNGMRDEIQPEDLKDPLRYTIVVQDKRFENDLTVLVGYVLLYLAYPLRTHRIMKAYQVQEIAYLLSQREAENSCY